MRYLVASLLTITSDKRLRQAYQAACQRPCRVKTLHLTFIPPFTTDSPEAVILHFNVPLTPTTYSIGTAGIFSRTHNILYCPLHPAAPLATYFKQLLPRIRSRITFESADFPTDTIPPFLPHITIDYQHEADQPPQLPSLNLTLTQPQLLGEQAPGIWRPYVV